jgi:hypothetical protein
MSNVWSIGGTRNYHEDVDNFGNSHLDGNVDLSDVDDEQYECWQSRQARGIERVGWGESTEQAAGVEYWRDDEEMSQQEHYRPQRSNAHWESQQHVHAHLLSHKSERDIGANMLWENNDDSDDGESGARIRAQLSPHRLRFARSLRERESPFTTTEQVVDHIAELWKDFADTMDHPQALKLLVSTRTCIQHVQQSLSNTLSRSQSQTNLPTLKVLELSTTFQKVLLQLNHKFAILCRFRSAAPDPSYECQFSEAKCGMVECLTKCAHQV